jgi:hypothetical protein
MATRPLSPADFNQGAPPPKKLVQVLAEDQNGFYLLPFKCEWRDEAWYRADKTMPLEAKIVGWRTWRY